MYYAHKAPCCQHLIDKYPRAASYIEGQLVIVGESFADHVGSVDDLSSLELDGEEGNAISKAELDIKIDELLAVGGKELILSKAQGLYLYNKHKPVIGEGI